MNDWLDKEIAVSTTETQDVITGKLVSIEQLGIVLSTTTKNKAAAPFVGLFEETTISLFIPFYRIKLMCLATFEGIT